MTSGISCATFLRSLLLFGCLAVLAMAAWIGKLKSLVAMPFGNCFVVAEQCRGRKPAMPSCGDG